MKEKVLFFGTFSLIVLIIVFVDFRELNKFIYPIFNGFGLLDGGNMSSLQRLSYGFRLTAIVVATVIMFWQFTFCQNVMSPIQTKISFAKCYPKGNHILGWDLYDMVRRIFIQRTDRRGRGTGYGICFGMHIWASPPLVDLYAYHRVRNCDNSDPLWTTSLWKGGK